MNIDGPSAKSPIETFSKKYTHSRGISRWLIERFFLQLHRLVGQANPQYIIEVGCGPGYSTETISKAAPNAKLVACDIEADLVAETQARVPHTITQVENIHRLTFANGEADLVVCLEVLEHVLYPKQAIAELARVTRKYAIISTPREPLWRFLNMMRGAYWREFGNTPGHINHWSTRELQMLVAPHFTLLQTSLPLPWTMLLLEKRTAPTTSADSSDPNSHT